MVAVVVVVRCDLGPSGGGYRPQDLAPKGGSLPGLASNGLRIGRIAATLACEGAPICELKGRLQGAHKDTSATSRLAAKAATSLL